MKDYKARLGIRPCTWIYLLLMFFSLVTYVVGKTGLSGLTVSLLVLLLALLKGHLVISTIFLKEK